MFGARRKFETIEISERYPDVLCLQLGAVLVRDGKLILYDGEGDIQMLCADLLGHQRMDPERHSGISTPHTRSALH